MEQKPVYKELQIPGKKRNKNIMEENDKKKRNYSKNIKDKCRNIRRNK